MQRALYATVYTPTLLRLHGARIGTGAEISTIQHVVPDLLDLGPGTFLADSADVGSDSEFRGVVTAAPVVIGERTFVGNSAVSHKKIHLPSQ